MRRRSTLTKINESFRRIAASVSNAAGSPWAFFAAFLLVVVWAAFGPYYHWSASHSLFINSITTVITFWMVFLVQSSQNQYTKAVLVKLDELIRTSRASNRLIEIEAQEESEIDQIRQEIREEIRSIKEDDDA